jgi:hypothetical protein
MAVIRAVGPEIPPNLRPVRAFCGIDPTAAAGWRNGKPCERFVI